MLNQSLGTDFKKKNIKYGAGFTKTTTTTTSKWPNACHLKWSFISEGTFQVKKIKIHFYIAVLAVDSKIYHLEF